MSNEKLKLFEKMNDKEKINYLYEMLIELNKKMISLKYKKIASKMSKNKNESKVNKGLEK